ncbi:SUMF1/EgtB/PvdO family nonheme iron enzyme [Rhizobacter sp. Root404]|uniref:SUMF1/EgtB/PvdO family nonheme iron enzyme n=1 Tax=Rhizobacter sp. Root404 TaxID=1736528 RepID=UPI000AB0376F
MQGVEMADVDTAQMRRAGRELLSLALMDARNHSLRWAAAFEGAACGAAPLLQELGRLGWFQEFWLARNVQRQRGPRGDATRPRLASILPGADAMFETGAVAPLPDLQTIRQYLVDSLEMTLELLEHAAEDDDALYFYRLALLREDACVERFAVLSQTLGFDTGLRAPLTTRPVRPPLLFPTTRWRLGSAPGGFVPDREHWAHEVALAEFEIDAQATTWAQYGEFVEDGGYDDRRFWSEPGWAWLQAQGRRTPRFVDQMRQGVLQQRFGKLVRVPLAQPALHVSWFEADAWCRWAGRRLPGEAEWEAAAVQGASRGFRWGEVREWTAGTLRPYPGHAGTSPGQDDDTALLGVARVLRGASFATRGRLRHERARDAALPTHDEGFCGFRSCAV